LTQSSSNFQPLAYLGVRSDRPVFYNLGRAQLIEHSVLNRECVLSQSGAVIVDTGVHTGRSPKDKYFVDHGSREDGEIAWGEVNKRISPENFQRIYSRLKEYISTRDLYVQDVTVGHHPAHSKRIRIVSELAWGALFARNLLIPSEFTQEVPPDFTLIHAPSFKADPQTEGTATGTFIIVDYNEHVVIIGDSSYAGEIKKAVFTLLNRVLPGENVLPMHCSANVGSEGDTALFFGLSGTGKTTLSSAADRALIGDDEHGWGEDGIYNFENGCYAKTINLEKDYEPLIWDASQRFGSVLENVGFDPVTRAIDFFDNRRTENTRAAYPLEYIPGHVVSGKGKHPENIFFLSADAFGVLPPVSLLSDNQAVYYFLLGYTAKLAGTEKGLGSEPEATFSTCFGEPFLPLSAGVYASILLQKIKQHKPRVWLINTGWSGGVYGVGSRIKLPYSRAMINFALSRDHDLSNFHTDGFFGLQIPRHIEGVPDELLEPINTWSNKKEYPGVAKSLIKKMIERMQKYASLVDAEILASVPVLPD